MKKNTNHPAAARLIELNAAIELLKSGAVEPSTVKDIVYGKARGKKSIVQLPTVEGKKAA